MINKFKQWVYKFVVQQLMTDTNFILHREEVIKNLYVQLEKERSRLLKEQADAYYARREKSILEAAAKRLASIEKKQSECSHKKGGRGLRTPCTDGDFNIWIHTFPGDVGTTVRCLTCSKEWKGEQIKSPEVRQMMRQTTNTPTSCEIGHGAPVDRTEPYIASGQTEAEMKVYAEEDARVSEEIKNNPLWPWASRGYVKYWDKMLKKLRRKKKVKNGPDNLS